MEIISPKNAFKMLMPERTVFVISYDYKNGRPSGMVAGYNMKCSSEPWMLAVSLWKEGYTHNLIQDCKEFVVAIPNNGMREAIEFFGSTHGDKIDKFKESGLKTIPAKFIKPPLIADATMNFECKLEKEVDCGDHVLFIGRILTAYVNNEKGILMNMGKIDGQRIFKEFTFSKSPSQYMP